MRAIAISTCLVVAACVPAAAPASWTPSTEVPGSGGAAVSRVAVSPNGTIAVAWGDAKVAIRRPGGTWLRVRRIATPNTTVASPDVAFDARGRLVAAWTQSPVRPGQPLTGPYEIRARTWTARGGWGGVRVLGRSGHFILAQPRIATNLRGDAIVSWRGFKRVRGRVVEALASSFRIAGGRFGPARTAASGGPYRDVTLDLRGNAYGVYTTYAGPRNYFVHQPRGRGWRKPERLPGEPASKPRIAVAGDRTAAIVWRAAAVDSEGDGIQAGPPWAILRASLGGYTFPVQLSTMATTDVGVTGNALLVTWAAPDFAEPAVPLDLHFTLRGEGMFIGGLDQTVPGARMGPSGYLNVGHGSVVVVYVADGAVRSVRWTVFGFGAPETLAPRGLNPSLATFDRRAVTAWFDPDRGRLRLARFVP